MPCQIDSEPATFRDRLLQRGQWTDVERAVRADVDRETLRGSTEQALGKRASRAVARTHEDDPEAIVRPGDVVLHHAPL